MSSDPRAIKSASEMLLDWMGSIRSDVTFYDLFAVLNERGFALLMLLFSLPLSIPLPVPPGFTTVLSMPLILLSAQFLFGCHRPWVPKWVGNKTLKREKLLKMVNKALPLLRRMEYFIVPRLGWLSGAAGEKIYAFTSLLCAISIAIPLPLTNFIPASGIAIMSLGLMSRDGLASLFGVAVSLLGLFVSALVIIFGPKFVMNLFYILTGFFQSS